jgi:allantoin racemase
MGVPDQQRILYIVPGIGLPSDELDRRRKILNQFARPPYRIEIQAVKEGPASIESYYDEFMSVPDTIRLAKDAEREGYSAVILGCFGDPGIEALRETLHIPVAGPGETSVYVAAILGHSFSIITILRNIVHPLKALTRKLGLQDRLASIRVINKPVLSIGRETEDTRNALLEAGRLAVQEDGADTLVLGCMSEAFLGYAEDLQEMLDVPVVNPVGVSVKMTELLLDAKLTHSKKAYPSPPEKVLIT